MNERLTGVFSAAATPLNADLSPDLDRMAMHCQSLLADGANGLAVLGSTGEANSFGSAERKAIIVGLLARGIAPDLLLPGAGLCNLPETIDLIRHGLDRGITRFLLLPPFYYKGVSDDGLFAYFNAIAQAVDDERLRIVLYHFPALSGVPLTSVLVGRLRAAWPEIFAGMKDSSGDADHTIAMQRAHPEFSLLAGADPTLLPVLRAGGAGCITALSNLAAAELAFVYRHHDKAGRADQLQAVQARIEALRKVSAAGVQQANIKAMLARRYGDPAWLRVRPPFVSAEPAQQQRLDRELREIDAEFPFTSP